MDNLACFTNQQFENSFYVDTFKQNMLHQTETQFQFNQERMVSNNTLAYLICIKQKQRKTYKTYTNNNVW